MGIADRLAELNADKSATNLQAGQDCLDIYKPKEGLTELIRLQYQLLTMGKGK